MDNKTIKHAVFVPVYNISIPNDIINTTVFDGYTFVRPEQIQNKYGNYINLEQPIVKQFMRDISKDHSEKSLLYPSADIVLVKICENSDIELEEDKIESELVKEIDNIILALRLTSKGQCKINSGYFLLNNDWVVRYFNTTTSIENIIISHETRKKNSIDEDIYNLDNSILKISETIYKSLDRFIENVRIPADYFSNYYDVITPQEKIVQISIVFESSILANIKDELKYRLVLRTSALLGKDVKAPLELFYDIRSNIVHNGSIEDCKSILTKLKNITGMQSKDETELLFYFVKDHIEPILREVLYKSFKILTETELNNFEALTKELDKFILKQVTKESFKLGIDTSNEY